MLSVSYRNTSFSSSVILSQSRGCPWLLHSVSVVCAWCETGLCMAYGLTFPSNITHLPTLSLMKYISTPPALTSHRDPFSLPISPPPHRWAQVNPNQTLFESSPSHNDSTTLRPPQLWLHHLASISFLHRGGHHNQIQSTNPRSPLTSFLMLPHLQFAPILLSMCGVFYSLWSVLGVTCY